MADMSIITAYTKSPTENNVHPTFVTAVRDVVAVSFITVVTARPYEKLHPKQNAPDKTDKTLIQIAEWSLRVSAKQINPTVIPIDTMYNSMGINGV